MAVCLHHCTSIALQEVQRVRRSAEEHCSRGRVPLVHIPRMHSNQAPSARAQARISATQHEAQRTQSPARRASPNCHWTRSEFSPTIQKHLEIHCLNAQTGLQAKTCDCYVSKSKASSEYRRVYLTRSPHRSRVNVCCTGAQVDTTQQEEIAAQKIGAQQNCKTRPLVEKIQITMDSTRTAI